MTVAATTTGGARPGRAGRLPSLAWVGTLPFLGYVGLFLLLPTGIVIWDAVQNPAGQLDLGSLKLLFNPAVRSFFTGSIELAGTSAVIGAVLGAVLAYAVAAGNPDGIIRKISLAGSGVLAQFGGITHVGGPLLAPAFLGAMLLLFANALSAYATIQAWENQIAYTVPQQIYIAINSEVGLASNEGDVLAFGMVVLVAIVMTAYALLQRRAARWLR